MEKKTTLLGVRFDCVSRRELEFKLKKLLLEDSFKYIVTPNPEIVELAQVDDEYKSILNNADMSIADGVGVEIASHVLNCERLERIPGIEIGEMLMSICAQSGYRLFFLGGKRGVAVSAAKRMMKKYKGLCVSGACHGYFSKEDSDKVINKIVDSRTDVLFVCMGFPYQEKWVHENFNKLTGVKLAICLGGSVDIYSGNVRRAPEAIRNAGLEWAWRATSSPEHLKRVLKLPRFVFRVVCQKCSERFKTALRDDFIVK